MRPSVQSAWHLTLFCYRASSPCFHKRERTEISIQISGWKVRGGGGATDPCRERYLILIQFNQYIHPLSFFRCLIQGGTLSRQPLLWPTQPLPLQLPVMHFSMSKSDIVRWRRTLPTPVNHCSSRSWSHLALLHIKGRWVILCGNNGGGSNLQTTLQFTTPIIIFLISAEILYSALLFFPFFSPLFLFFFRLQSRLGRNRVWNIGDRIWACTVYEFQLRI